MIQPLVHIDGIAPYPLADIRADQGIETISLAQNESLRSPSPKVIEAIQHTLSHGHLYPDPDWTELRMALSAVHGLDAGQILCGAGSMELIAALAHAYLDRNHHALASDHAYAFFQTAAERVGSRLIKAPETDFRIDIEALLSGVTRQTRIVFVVNPGNPTGTSLPISALETLRSALPETVLLVIDEAYGEFLAASGNRAFDLVALGNTVVLRTFSKAYGLASARVGWGYFPTDIATTLRKVLNPNNISTVSQVAAAAAVQDQPYMKETCRMISDIRTRFTSALTDIGFRPPQSATNFVLIPFENAAQAQSADTALRDAGIVMRGMASYALPHCLRATIAGDSVMKRTIGVLREWRSQERGT